jgi:hypothetical protein
MGGFKNSATTLGRLLKIQIPKIAFRDPFLRSCAIERNALGLPRAWAGSFAVVYKGQQALAQIALLRERRIELSKSLRTRACARSSAFRRCS